MSAVGSFPGIAGFNRRTVRAPLNPMDKSTVISIFGKYIDERKVTIEPGRFVLTPGSYEKPSFLVVGSSSWWKEIDDQQPLLEIPNSSIQVADSIVKDYCNGLFGCNMSDAMPGLFWLPGIINLNILLKDHKEKLEAAKARQINYFKNLVSLTDSLWSRTNGSPLCVSDEARIAAKELGLDKNKEWMRDFTTLGQTNCPACGHMVNPAFPVCANCKNVIDKVRAKELGLTFAN